MSVIEVFHTESYLAFGLAYMGIADDGGESTVGFPSGEEHVAGTLSLLEQGGAAELSDEARPRPLFVLSRL